MVAGLVPLDPADLDAVLAPFGASKTLPAAAYTSDEVFDWEREALFASTWVCLGRVNEMLAPGQVRAVALAGESVLVARESEGRVRVFSNVCRHRGHELAPVGDAFDARLIRCPYHSWSYRLDGSLRSAPTLTQSPDFDPSDYSLVELSAATSGGWLWIDLSSSSPPLEDHFGNLWEQIEPYESERLRTAATHDYTVRANWKSVVENYNECYHCSTIHPELCRVTPPDSGRDRQPTGMWLGGSMELKPHAETMSLDGRSQGVIMRRVDGDLARQVLYLTVMPNLLLSLHPDYVMTHVLTPLDPDQTQIECSWLFPPEAWEREDFDPAYAVDFWDITNREDWAACEGVMRGMGNRGYRPGPLSSWEGTVYQFLTTMAHLYRGDGLVVPTAPDRDRPAYSPTGSE
ncbi:MAG: aromatic ring-hydroxylating oxygenase subunit alpha [Acidimicrobiia bacterium]